MSNMKTFFVLGAGTALLTFLSAHFDVPKSARTLLNCRATLTFLRMRRWLATRLLAQREDAELEDLERDLWRYLGDCRTHVYLWNEYTVWGGS